MDVHYKEALSYFRENWREGCSNGPDNKEIIRLIEELYSLGIQNIQVCLYGEEERYEAELFLKIEENVSKHVLCEIVQAKPDEISIEEEYIRLWWD